MCASFVAVGFFVLTVDNFVVTMGNSVLPVPECWHDYGRLLYDYYMTMDELYDYG